MAPPDDSTQRLAGFGQSTKLTLHLGVLDQPYADSPARSTGDVAEILEAKYGVMEAFWRVHGQQGADALADSAAGALESLMMGHRADPFAHGCQVIQDMFKDFISSGEAEQVGIPGTPTKAALKGVSHRRKHPYRSSNPRRVSFRDTGLYVGDFRAWVD